MSGPGESDQAVKDPTGVAVDAGRSDSQHGLNAQVRHEADPGEHSLFSPECGVELMCLGFTQVPSIQHPELDSS
jgi:hypothetical protein